MIDYQFSVSLLREQIELASHVVCDGPFEWSKEVSFRICCFIWRARLGRIPSSVELSRRAGGVTITSITFGSCYLEEESSDHILLSCPLAKTVIDSILSWCEIQDGDFQSVKDVLLYISRWSRCKKKRSLLNVVFFRGFVVYLD